jgi:hypothetical protein
MNVPSHMRKFYFAEDGRELTAAERAEKYAKLRVSSQERGDASILHGTYQERQAFRRDQTNVDIVVKQRVEAKAREGRGPRNVFREREQYLRDSGAAKHEIQYWKIGADKLDASRAEQARQAEYQSSDAVRLMLEHAEATERSHKNIWPNADPAEVGVILATARSTSFVDIAAHSASYWAAVSEIETKMYLREEQLLAEKAEKTAFVTAEHIEQAKRAADAQARMEVAAQHLGDQGGTSE